MKMLKTGLPYNMDNMNYIKENGAIVDMSNINFPGIDKKNNAKTSFIFLRNTGFNVILDYSSCTYEEKENFIISYITETIKCDRPELVSTYTKILNKLVGIHVDIECILSDEEIDKFIKNNNEFIVELIRFVKSLPLFALKCFALNDMIYSLDDFETTDAEPFSDNIYSIINNDTILSFFDGESSNIEPKIYNKLFNYENTNLLETVILKLPFFGLLYGLSTKNNSNWEKIIEEINNFER